MHSKFEFPDELFSSRFDFMADFFPSSETMPILSEVAEFAREAELNLRFNTRYSIICLGDIGEAFTYILLKHENITVEKDQIDRIKMLLNHSVIPKDISDLLHELRIARNQAIHSRYNLISKAEILLSQAFDLCEWLFGRLISKNDIVKAQITGEDENYIYARVGHIPAKSEKSEKSEKNFNIGDVKLFRFLNLENNGIILSSENVNFDPWVALARRYEKYEINQTVNAVIKSVTQSAGATVELNDGLKALVPDSEIGHTISYSKGSIKYDVKAKIKWINPNRYPYMIVSIKDTEDENISLNKRTLKNHESDSYELDKTHFIKFCKTAKPDEILKEIAKGADVNVQDKHGMTALMIASMYNNAKSVKILLKAGANINLKNKDNFKAVSFAMSNKKLMNNKSLINLLKGLKPKKNHNHKKFTTKAEVILPMKTKEDYEREFLRTCRSGSESEIQEAVNAGVNVNVKNKSLSTALMFAAKNNTANSIEILIKAGAYLDAQDIYGNTALIYAASFNTDDVVETLIDSGADIEMQNISGYKAIDYAKQNYRLEDTNAIKKLS